MADIVFRVTRGFGQVVTAPSYVHGPDGTPYVFVRATAASLPALAGKVIVAAPDGSERELSARLFGLTVSRVIPQHDDPSGRWCPFSGVSQPAGECPVHPGPEAA